MWAIGAPKSSYGAYLAIGKSTVSMEATEQDAIAWAALHEDGKKPKSPIQVFTTNIYWWFLSSGIGIKFNNLKKTTITTISYWIWVYEVRREKTQAYFVLPLACVVKQVQD